jgi:bisphosphoglycerate-dependent phosphoglycerate mutase
MKLIIVRHGETDEMQKKFFWTFDNKLYEKGRAQAQEIGRKLNKKKN